MGVQFIGNAVYTSVWVAAVCLFMELLGFSTQKWITAGGFGTVLLTLAGREVFLPKQSFLISQSLCVFPLSGQQRAKYGTHTTSMLGQTYSCIYNVDSIISVLNFLCQGTGKPYLRCKVGVWILETYYSSISMYFQDFLSSGGASLG